MPISLLMLARESATLGWDMHPDVFAYEVRRIHTAADGVRHDVQRAIVYEGVYCDPRLEPATEYMFEVSSLSDPPLGPDEPPADQQRVRFTTPPELEFASARLFFTELVAPTFRKRLHSSFARWCPRWASHPEVLYAVTEMWHAYEAMRPPAPPQHPGKVRAEWLLTVAWPMLDRLSAPEGPMRDCYLDDHEGERHVEPGEEKTNDLPDTPVAPLP